jgi:hypothetical protein
MAFGTPRLDLSWTGRLPWPFPPGLPVLSILSGLSGLSARPETVRRYDPSASAVLVIRSRSLPGGITSGMSVSWSAVKARSPRLRAESAHDAMWRATCLPSSGVSASDGGFRVLRMRVRARQRVHAARAAQGRAYYLALSRHGACLLF